MSNNVEDEIFNPNTVFPRIVRARSINFTVCVMRGQFEGALYSRVRSNSSRAVY